MKKLIVFFLFLLLAFFIVTNFSQTSSKKSNIARTTKNYSYKVVNSYNHDPSAFTQGLIFRNGFLYESTGLYGKSTLRKVDLTTGKVLKKIKLSKNYFGEGITEFDNKIYQLTWKSRIGFIYDPEDFEIIGEFSYPTDGWGLTNNGKHLILSNGSPTLFFLDPKTFKIAKKIRVIDNNDPVYNLNELEFFNNKIYANIWRSNKIISIDPNTGNVLEWIDLSGLLKYSLHNGKADVLNGIAYDKTGNKIFVTGKFWPRLFQIELVK